MVDARSEETALVMFAPAGAGSVTDRAFDELIDTIYEALMDGAVLDPVPTVLAGYCGARSCRRASLRRLDPSGAALRFYKRRQILQ
jgi:hypothetical protein